jgi:hypothetical protein
MAEKERKKAHSMLHDDKDTRSSDRQGSKTTGIKDNFNIHVAYLLAY